jgi:hypothetical protein
MNLEVKQLDEELKKINNIITFIKKVPYKIENSNFDKINETNITKFEEIIKKMKDIKDVINDSVNINTLLSKVNIELEKNRSKINSIITNKYDNLMLNYLLILLLSIKISLSMPEDNTKIKDHINNHSYINNLNKDEIFNITFNKEKDKILFANKFYLEVLLFSSDKKIIYNFTNKDNNSVIKIIEFYFTKDSINKKIIIDKKSYNLS